MRGPVNRDEFRIGCKALSAVLAAFRYRGCKKRAGRPALPVVVFGASAAESGRNKWGFVSEEKAKDAPVVIKKYANRRLYNTQTSSYVTLDHLATMVKEGTDFEVQDARTGEDITRSVLTQIIFEEEAKGQNLLPIKFLRQLIRFYGDSLQAFVPGYLDMSMDSFTKNQGAMRDRIAEAMGGGNQMIENLTRQNLAIFERAMQMFSPFGGVGGAAAPGRKPDEAPAEKPAASDVDALKREMEAMRRQLSELSQRK
jgi:polyhydroxyalkanoate synthesis repressor PhaR